MHAAGGFPNTAGVLPGLPSWLTLATGIGGAVSSGGEQSRSLTREAAFDAAVAERYIPLVGCDDGPAVGAPMGGDDPNLSPTLSNPPTYDAIAAPSYALASSMPPEKDDIMDPKFVFPQDYRQERFNAMYDTLYPFQKEVFCRACQRSTIIFLPTGAGKTVVAAALAAYKHALDPTKKIIFIVNRIPLISQQAHVLHRFGLRVAQVCGDKRDAKCWADIIEYFDAVVIMDAVLRDWVTRFSTALFADCSLVVFDEIHHARKESNYARLFQLMGKEFAPHVIGLSASPSARESRDKTRKALEELMGLTRCQVATVVREMADLDLRLSVPESELMEFEPSRMEKINDELVRNCIRAIERIVIPLIRAQNPALSLPLESCVGLPYGSPQYVVKAREAVTVATQMNATGCRAVAATLEMLNHALIVLEEWSLVAFAKRILNEPTNEFIIGPADGESLPEPSHEQPSTLRRGPGRDEWLDHRIRVHLHMIVMPLIMGIMQQITKGTMQQNVVSTKMKFLFCILGDVVGDCLGDTAAPPSARVVDREALDSFRGIVFCATKAATVEITTRLRESPLGRLLNPMYFVGHGRTLIEVNDEAHSISMNDTKQQKVLQAFREGETKLIIATSVAEEGLDIPMCNLVVRYEGFFSSQSFIQSRGRARKRGSRFIVIAKMTPCNPFADVLKDCAIQDEVIREMCCQDQDAVITANELSTPLRAFEADPLRFLHHVRVVYGATHELELRPCRGGMQAIVAVRLPDGTEIRGMSIGHEQRASHEARVKALQQLYVRGLIQLDTVVSSASSTQDQDRFRYFANPSVALTRQAAVSAGNSLLQPNLPQADLTSYITEYNAEHWGPYLKPFLILHQELRARGLQPPRASPNKDNANEAFVEFQMRTLQGELKWFRVTGHGESWDVALQTAAMVALRAMKVYALTRPHSLTKPFPSTNDDIADPTQRPAPPAEVKFV